jgi:hypothetical protein
MTAEAGGLVCSSCWHPPEAHGDSDEGPMSVCPPRDILALEASLTRALARRGDKGREGDQ